VFAAAADEGRARTRSTGRRSAWRRRALVSHPISSPGARGWRPSSRRSPVLGRVLTDRVGGARGGTQPRWRCWTVFPAG